MRDITENRILDSDSYKAGHWSLYPKNTTGTFSYLEGRGSDIGYEESVFFGLQYILKRYFADPITMDEVEEAKEIIEAHGEPFNYDGWKHIVEDHEGNLPIRIRAVPEGTVVPLHNALMTVETTCPKCFWVASYFETVLMRVWYPITVATQSYYIKKMIKHYLDISADDPDAEIAFKLHDFGSRGVSSKESAGIGGLAHLINFMGTDTMQALITARKFYHEPMAGFSIPAAEHSTFSSWGRDHEVDAYRNMLKTFGGKYPLMAFVSDTWDIYYAIGHIWGEQLKQEVIDSGSTIVIRPDSGNPREVVVKCLRLLAEKFGYTINKKGFMVLNNVRLIQGDGVNPESIHEILEDMIAWGFSVTNIAFGMGGALLQKVDRDTLKMAYKCSSAIIDGKETDVYKDPITDSGKRSKKGRLDLIKVKGNYVTDQLADTEPAFADTEMITYFENGEILVDETFANIRERASLTKTAKYDTIGK